MESSINQIQMLPLHQQDHSLENSLILRYEHTLSKLNQYYKQRSKKGWVKDGDRNTRFFHQAVLKRRKRNTICSIKDENDVTHFKPSLMLILLLIILDSSFLLLISMLEDLFLVLICQKILRI